MFEPSQMRLTSPFPVTLKHEPFKPETGKSRKAFTYKNINGQVMTLAKKTYSWYDPTPRDPKGNPTGEVQEAQLKVDSTQAYNYEEYERNEWERISYIEGWPQYEAYAAMLVAPAELQTEVTKISKAVEKGETARAALEIKVKNVADNYRQMFQAYGQVRTELVALNVELPILKDSPFASTYILDFMPVVENMLKVELPHMVEDPYTPTPTPAKPTAEATATGS